MQINARKPRYKSINYHFCAFISEEVAGFKRRNATKEVKKEERLSSSFFCGYRFDFSAWFYREVGKLYAAIYILFLSGIR